MVLSFTKVRTKIFWRTAEGSAIQCQQGAMLDREENTTSPTDAVIKPQMLIGLIFENVIFKNSKK